MCVCVSVVRCPFVKNFVGVRVVTKVSPGGAYGVCHLSSVNDGSGHLVVEVFPSRGAFSKLKLSHACSSNILFWT